jgi:stage V sporulation protein G
MEITDIQINLAYFQKSKIRAFCSVFFDNEFVVHEVKIIEEPLSAKASLRPDFRDRQTQAGLSACSAQAVRRLHISMPNKKITMHCVKCAEKNPINANFCSKCGVKLTWYGIAREKNTHSEIYTDIVQVISGKLTRLIRKKILTAYQDKLSAIAPVPGECLPARPAGGPAGLPALSILHSAAPAGGQGSDEGMTGTGRRRERRGMLISIRYRDRKNS